MHCKQLINHCIACCMYALLLLNPVHGQYARSYIPPSPNAASLGAYGQVPVSEYSGVPNIQIPLHMVETDGFSMPVALNYHSAGFRIKDEASWVGLGWSLSAGGVITRSKRHKNDFGPNGFFRTTSSRPCGNDVDQEPDMFFYNIGGKSGKFFMVGPSPGYVRYFNQDNMKIEYNNLRESWTLTTGEGIIYTFDTREYTHEKGVDQEGGTVAEETYVSTWYLTSIELAHGTKITFSYNTSNNTKIISTSRTGTSDMVISYYPLYLTDVCCPVAHGLLKRVDSWVTTTVTTNEVVLSQIDFPNGAITLHTGSRIDLKVASGTAPAKKLDSIRVYAGENVLKSFAFSYDYFVSDTFNTPDIANRLRLRSVVEKTPAASFKPYTINYSGNKMPAKMDGSRYLDTTGLLKSIVYPTGGYVNFVFEPHPLFPPFSTNTGARIQKIYVKDAADSFDVRRFEYIGARLMGKIMHGTIIPYSANTLLGGECCGMPVGMGVEITRQRNYSSDFSSLGETINGNIVGYDTVITWFGENGKNGKKVSCFENVAPADPDYKSGSVPIPVPLNTSNKNGTLRDEYEYKNNNDTFVLVRRTRTTYGSANTITTAARRFAYDNCGWTYSITTENVRITNQVVWNYDMTGNNPLFVTTNYLYDDAANSLPTRILVTDSKGQELRTTNYYAKQKSAQEGGVYTTMLNRNMISIVIDQEKARDSILTSKSITTYKDWFNNGKLLKPETVRFKKPGNYDADITMRFNEYDEHGNVLSMSKEAGKPVCYKWGYGSAYPTAEVVNADSLPFTEVVIVGHNVGQLLDLTTQNYQNFETFTSNTAQTYSFSVKVTPVMESGSFNGIVILRLMKTGSSTPLFERSYTSGNTYNETATLPSGTESYYFSASVYQPGTGTRYIRLDITSSYKKTNSYHNWSYTSFEDAITNYAMDAKTGKKSYKGVYMVSMKRKPGRYIMSWWQKPGTGGNWVYHEQIYNLTTSDNPPAGAGDLSAGANILVDEVRWYPQFAAMTTYTYEPQIGMTSKCDERNQVTYYEYDELRRLKLIRDHDGNIIKSFEYNYKNQ